MIKLLIAGAIIGVVCFVVGVVVTILFLNWFLEEDWRRLWK